MEELISVIVPIYNVEKYVNKCVDSIMSQTYKNIEIILVDDGSTDKSGSIVEEYKNKDVRIKVIHKENGGLSDARNYGMKYSNGKYLLFIDSDDWIDNSMIEIIYRNLKEYNADISICEFIEEDEKGEKLSYKKYDDKIHIFDSKDAIRELITQKYITNHAWNKLYKKEVFNNVEYPKGQLMEDVSTTYKLIENSNKVVYQNTSLYHYIQRSKSILGNINARRINDQEKAFFERDEYLLKKYPEYKTEIEIDYIMNIKTLYYLAIMCNEKSLYNSKKYKEYYKKTKKIYINLKDNIEDKDKKSMKLFYKSRFLYKIYVKLKKVYKERK